MSLGDFYSVQSLMIRGGYYSTPQSVLDVYPQAFSILAVDDLPPEQNETVIQAVLRGFQ